MKEEKLTERISDLEVVLLSPVGVDMTIDRSGYSPSIQISNLVLKAEDSRMEQHKNSTQELVRRVCERSHLLFFWSAYLSISF